MIGDNSGPVDFLGADPLATAELLEDLAADLRGLAAGSLPSPGRLREAPHLRRWGFAPRSALCLAGTAYGHPRIVDGRECVTSEIFAIARDRSWARTLSRYYQLGPPKVFGLNE